MGKSHQAFTVRVGCADGAATGMQLEPKPDCDLRRPESDVQTLVYNNIPALGVSGKQGLSPSLLLASPILREAQEIFVVQEPDAEDFADEVIASFPKGKAHRLLLPTKDPSELWLQSNNPEEFGKAWTQAIVGAYDNSIAQSDTGNAERLVKMHGHNFRWVTDAGVFCVWDGAIWRRDKRGDNLLPQTKEVVRAIADPGLAVEVGGCWEAHCHD